MSGLPPRLRYYALYVAVAAMVAAAAAASVLAVRSLQNGNFTAFRPAALAGWLGLSSLPALVVAPVVGVLAGSGWNRLLLVVTLLIATAVLAWPGFNPNVPWLSMAAILALNLAFFGTAAVVRLVSSARQERRWPPGVSVGLSLCLVGAGGFGTLLAPFMNPYPFPLANALLLTAAYFAFYLRDPLPDPVPLSRGLVRPFVEGVRESLRQRRGRHALVGLWVWGVVFLAIVVAAFRIENARPSVQAEYEPSRLAILIPPTAAEVLTNQFLLAVIGGVVLSAFNRHPYRHVGFVLYAALAAFGALLWLRFADSPTGPHVLLGFALGLALSPLFSFYLVWTNAKHHGVAIALVVAGWSAGALALAAVLVSLGDDPLAARTPLLNILLAVTALAFVVSFGSFFRPAMELTLETLLWPVYRIRAVGPGLEHLPARGPCLVIGNHGGWFDPLFFAKVLPAPIVPMMTSKFYDLPVLAWLMRHVIGTIRVPDKTVRHEAPELKEAVAALDRGECVVLFPEGYLRRKEEVPLRRFGRGIWQILNDRPNTPLFACWIDGAWGSYVSYAGGPPTKGKRPDFWRRIRIGVHGPIAVDPTILKDHMATRTFLMQQVAEARRPLGLEPLELPTTGETDGDKE